MLIKLLAGVVALNCVTFYFIFAFVVLEVPDDSIDRKPVDVHVENIHENGHLYAAVFEIFRFFRFFNDHDFTVGRG